VWFLKQRGGHYKVRDKKMPVPAARAPASLFAALAA
jgi:hypothetical protein